MVAFEALVRVMVSLCSGGVPVPVIVKSAATDETVTWTESTAS